jgi:hypothetical protein
VVTGLGFKAPKSVDELVVRERLHGDAATDMGSLTGDEPAFDAQPADRRDHQRLIKFLEASWRTFDQIVEDAKGKQLRTGPRGGGRNLDKIVQHVLDAEGGYLRRLDYKREKAAEQDVQLTRKAMLEALAASVQGEVAEYGPRGGKRWTARYFVRREVWHVVDHAWEIEDRIP